MDFHVAPPQPSLRLDRLGHEALPALHHVGGRTALRHQALDLHLLGRQGPLAEGVRATGLQPLLVERLAASPRP